MTGTRGPTGATGTVDTSNFYDKAASDARFIHGNGAVYRADGTVVWGYGALLVAVPGLGQLALTSYVSPKWYSVYWENTSGIGGSDAWWTRDGAPGYKALTTTPPDFRAYLTLDDSTQPHVFTLDAGIPGKSVSGQIAVATDNSVARYHVLLVTDSS